MRSVKSAVALSFNTFYYYYYYDKKGSALE